MTLASELALNGRTLLCQSIEGCFASAIADRGLSRAEFDQALERATPHLDQMKQLRADASLALLGLGDDLSGIEAIHAAYQRLAADAKTIVFFGTGGSGLGGQTLAQFGGWSIPGVSGFADPSGAAGKATKRPPRTRFYDNLDPFTLASSLARLDLEHTRFVVTSKSGRTPETLSQVLAAVQAVKAAGLEARIADMFLGITEPCKAGVQNGLRNLLTHFGAPCLDHHAAIGGRFSVLTNVGLLPAVSRGADPVRILAGAKAVIDALEAAEAPADFAPLIAAVTAVELASKRGIKVQVMMPYADRLGRLGDWYVQLWAESLGKQGKGTTPLACLGPLDQHSQLQLFMDGPPEHYLTFVRVPTAGGGPVIDKELAAIANIDELAGQTVGDLVAAQTQAVPEALRLAGRPVRLFDIPNLDEEAMGALLMHLMLETIFAGWLIGVDPFDQPAVELGKVLTRKHLVGPI